MGKTITLPLDMAKEMYKEGGTGKKFALQHYSEEELARVELAKRWKDLPIISGFYISEFSETLHIEEGYTITKNRNVFATKKQAESALAMAMLSQLMKQANEGWEPDWRDPIEIKYTIYKGEGGFIKGVSYRSYEFLAFKDKETRDEFFENHRKLIITYCMIEL